LSRRVWQSGAKYRMNGRHGFTLAEMIMAVALLAVFSVIIVQIFVKADQLTRKAACLDQAVACASDLADMWKMEDTAGVPQEILDLRENRLAGRSVAICLTSDFAACLAIQAEYQAVLTIQPYPVQTPGQAGEGTPGTVWQLTVMIGRAELSDCGPLYTLQATRYFPEEVSAP
jgi:prepilin-type N-terminal cleavage/methylation domain-containing protein